jgi:glucuronate isomerase
LAQATNIEIGDAQSLRTALTKVFEHFVGHGAKACAVSLPPDFAPLPASEETLSKGLREVTAAGKNEGSRLAESEAGGEILRRGVFWVLVELCRQVKLPFALMIGVNREAYRGGVHQGGDLFDQRTSLIQYAELFNAFPDVAFCVSVLSSSQNQELVSYSWIFPNVYTFGHWWYANIPSYVALGFASAAASSAEDKTNRLLQ